jgi:hypothetical protein
MTVVDGPGFHVDVDKVDEAANGIHQSVQDQNNFELRGLCGDTELYGHPPLHDALMDFSVRWSDGLDVLTDDAGQIGDALSRVSTAYRAVDGAAVNSLPGDPGAGTVDPRALVPGKPEAIEENARVLRTETISRETLTARIRSRRGGRHGSRS